MPWDYLFHGVGRIVLRRGTIRPTTWDHEDTRDQTMPYPAKHIRMQERPHTYITVRQTLPPSGLSDTRFKAQSVRRKFFSIVYSFVFYGSLPASIPGSGRMTDRLSIKLMFNEREKEPSVAE